MRRLDVAIRLRVKTLALQNEAVPETQASRAAYITPAEVEWLLGQSRAPRAGVEAADVRRELARLNGVIEHPG